MISEKIEYEQSFGPVGEGRCAMPRPAEACIESALSDFNERNPDATIQSLDFEAEWGKRDRGVVKIEARK